MLEGLVGRRVRLVLARCDQVSERDLEVVEGVLTHVARDRVLVSEGGRVRVVERGWIIEAKPLEG
ncbi:hypothetical protein [Pyrobaculum ferrireducens]|uniref:Uncharacterized protein n=1 Tax=Pyrobaculum ferrireducens TaxID=1104324 RepID=G7VHI4_9CREN|nr:hypothetical protein [Pyrobaculum ferrireducens]AET33275.1 hypothetical protein P186_1873 [Pyrobaculum ferrireducens]